MIREQIRKALGLETRAISVINPSTLSLTVPASNLAGTPGAATAVPAVYQCVNMIADSISMLPWNAYSGNVPASPVPPVLRRPDPWNSVQKTRRQIVTTLLVHGNAFLYLTAPGRDGKPTVAIPIVNDEVQVSWNESRTRPVYRWRGVELELNREIAHIKMMDGPGELYGLGPIQASRLSLQTAITEEQSAYDSASTGGVPDGVVAVPGKLTQDEADLIRGGWDERHQGKRGVAFLTGGMQWTSTRMSNQDLQFLEQREYSIRDVGRMFRVPAAMLNAVNDGGGITYRNLEGVYTEYTRMAIEPIAERLEEAFGELLPSTRTIRFDYGRLLRADIQTRFNTYAVARQNGIYTTNEIREEEGRDPLPGGDRLEFRTEQVNATVSGELNDPEIQEAVTQ